MVSDNTENTGNDAEAPSSTAMWNQDGSAGAETEIVDSGPDTQIVDSGPRQIETPSAWSEVQDYPELSAPRSWRGTAVRAGAILATALVAAGGVWAWDHRHTAPRTAPAPAPDPAANGPVLDGIYAIASDNQHAIANGVLYPSTDVTRYWAFRSLCTPARCVATAAEVSDTNHQVANYDHDHSVWVWTFGAWSEVPDHNTTPCGGNGSQLATGTLARTLAPQPDGTLKGTEMDVINGDSPCAAGAVVKRPITAKRIGDTPKGLVDDPATAPPDIGLDANQYVAIAVPRGATAKGAYSGTGQTADYARQIAFTECREHAGADSDCAVVETNLKGCVASAASPTGGFAGGKGPTPDAARDDARANMPTAYWVSDAVCSK
jgi:hypothetical protein